MTSGRPNLYEFAGGREAFRRLAAAHHERCLADPVLNHPFSHPGHPQHVERLGDYWAEVLGGPSFYTTECNDQSAMLTIHADNGAEADLGERFLACFLQAMDDVNLPDDAEFRDAMRAYMAWAVTDVLVWAPYGSVVPDGLSIPHWSWDGLVEQS